MTKKNKEIIEILNKTYPDAHCELDHETPFQLLVSTILSAQTTDVQVNKVMGPLYQELPALEDWLPLTELEIQEKIKTIGLYRNKAKNLWKLFRSLVENYNGQVPGTMEDLVSLPGVGRKTANVVLSNAFQVPAIAVDTHVQRVSNRIGLANSTTPEKTEQDLMKNLNKNLWSLSHHLLIFHGRRTCVARRPQCEICPLTDYCKYYKKVSKEGMLKTTGKNAAKRRN